MRLFLAAVALCLAGHMAIAQTTVSFRPRTAVWSSPICTDPAIGPSFWHMEAGSTKKSWKDQARQLTEAGFQVLAIDFRGYGKSHGPGDSDVLSAPLGLDVLAAVRYIHHAGAKSVSVIGGSMGGGAAGDASIASMPGEIDKLVFLGSAPNGPADKLKSPSLFIVARDDASGDGPRRPGIRAKYDRAREPKKLVILDGSAHAQFLFQTDQAARVMREILDFLGRK